MQKDPLGAGHSCLGEVARAVVWPTTLTVACCSCLPEPLVTLVTRESMRVPVGEEVQDPVKTTVPSGVKKVTVFPREDAAYACTLCCTVESSGRVRVRE